ncbi:hypothetical protein Ancab_008520 [Ancistrocladus abbreviatus]
MQSTTSLLSFVELLLLLLGSAKNWSNASLIELGLGNTRARGGGGQRGRMSCDAGWRERWPFRALSQWPMSVDLSGSERRKAATACAPEGNFETTRESLNLEI